MSGPGAGTAPGRDRTVAVSRRGTTRRFALSRTEWATTAIAAVVSSAAYVAGGFSYLARGVVGDLTGFLLLGVAGAVVGARLKHEALICLALIGVVLLLEPEWPLRLSEPLWWGLFTIGLAAYLAVRRTICD